MRTEGSVEPAGWRPARVWRGGLNIGRVILALLAALAITHLASARAEGKASPEARSGGWSGRLARWLWLPVALYTAGVFAAVNYVLPELTSPDLNLYVVQPLLWGLLAVVSLVLLRRSGSSLVYPRLVFFGLLAAAFHVASLVGAGILYGFGYSPYAREPLHMLENGFYLSTMVLGVECCRAYLLSVFHERRPFLAVAVLSVLFGLLLIPVNNYRLLDSPQSGFHVAGETFLPALAQSVLASYLVVRGGFLPAFLYHGGILAFEWFSPILPALEWTPEAFITTVAPIISLLTTRSALAETAMRDTGQRRFDVSAPWIVASIIVVALLWFNTGLLGVTPAAVTGVSMEPTMHTGDLVLMHQVKPGELEVGDIIQFRAGQTRVFHRIVQIEDTAEGRIFVTKGDNNNTPDDPILEGQIEGRIVFTVPKVGWIPLKVDELLSELR
jgi:signal peptidase